jgi:cell cycle sensor histidine kinase DivJ
MPTEPHQRVEYARIIHSSADHLLSVVNLVLDMSRIEAGKFAISPEPLELAPLIRECCDMLRLRARAGEVEIVVAPMAPGLELVADKSACRQIVVNLLSNAVKFTPPRGRVAIEASVEAGTAKICVTDTGIGIRPEDLPRLGDPFFQVDNGYDRSFEGAGLGLSLVRGLVGLHDGALLLESACGVGTRVTATLPRLASLNARRPNLARLETLPRLTLPAILREHREDRRIA